MRKKLRYACIGAGGIAQKKHLNGYSKLPQVTLAAICDTNRPAAEALAQEFNIPHVYTDYREMLEKESLDLVSVCTPNATHKDITVYALSQGCHVHVEKPMALNAVEAQEILDAQKKYGKLVQVGLNKRFLSNTVLLRRLLHEDFFGDLYRVRCGWERNSGIPGVGRWFTDRALSGGGALIDLGVHYLDLAMWVLNWPTPQKVLGSLSSSFLADGTRIRRGYKSADGPVNVEGGASGSVQMTSGQTLDYCFSWASNIQREVRYLEAYGAKAGFRLEDEKLQLFTQLGGTMFTLTPDEATMPLDENEFQSFVDCILEGKTPEASAEQGCRVLSLIDFIYENSFYYGGCHR